MTNETVRDVCAEIKRINGKDCTSEAQYLERDMHELADRILTAHEREMAAKDAEIARTKNEITNEQDITMPKVIIEFDGRRYVADDDSHMIDVGVDDTGAELVVEKMGMRMVVNLKEVNND